MCSKAMPVKSIYLLNVVVKQEIFLLKTENKTWHLIVKISHWLADLPSAVHSYTCVCHNGTADIE